MPLYRVFNSGQGRKTLRPAAGGFRRIAPGETIEDFEMAGSHAAYHSAAGLTITPLDDDAKDAMERHGTRTDPAKAEERQQQRERTEGEQFADTFIGRKLDDISDDEVAALTDEQREAVIAAERDREQPRKGLLSRLGVVDED